MIIELYENGVNFLWPIVLKLTLLVFLIYVIPFLITYAKGERVCWCETSVKDHSFNPIKNRDFSTIFVSPILLLITGIILSFTLKTINLYLDLETTLYDKNDSISLFNLFTTILDTIGITY